MCNDYSLFIIMFSILLLVSLLAASSNAFQASSKYKYFQKFQSALGGKTASAPFDKTFDRFVDHTLSKWHVPGLAIAVIKDGVTYTKVTDAHHMWAWRYPAY